ncbi:alpha-galactosidase [Lacticaseibacillus paracasei]|nr:alpha-galactosidase [Lacticaseibacillus paracasei]MCT3332504.1 alpha-galactosidase [Lacticaseibacillus paracasei]
MAQKPPHKDLGHNDQSAVIASQPIYVPVSNRISSRSPFIISHSRAGSTFF